MKIGLYVQDNTDNRKKEEKFKNVVNSVRKEDIDLLIFPEFTFIPNTDYYTTNICKNEGVNKINNMSLKLSKFLGCAVIIGAQTDGSHIGKFIYNSYANAFSKKDETKTKIYLKHVATEASPFGFKNYKVHIPHLFEPIYLKGKKIGTTICFECNNSLFSRAYNKSNIDIIINSTGGNVKHMKWYRHNKVRAIENNCFSFCTMGYDENKNGNSFAFAFNPNGKSMDRKPLFPIINNNDIDNVFIYDTETDDLEYEKDINFNQKETSNNKGLVDIDAFKINTLLSSSEKIDKNLFVKILKDYSGEEYNIILVETDKDEIIKPEIVLKRLFNPKLKSIKNKKYIIINKWDNIDESYYSNILSDVLKSRATENFCAVLLISNNITKCYQSTKAKDSQVLKLENNKYIVDLKRMGGPESIWRGKSDMKSKWRKGYEELINYVAK